MTYVDSAVLNLTERMCRLFQAWTGRTNVWLAFQLTNLSIVVYFIWVAALYWLSVDLALRVFVALFCGGVFFVLTRTLFKVSIELSETEAYRRLAKGLRNPRRIRDVQLRIAFLTLSVVLSYPLWLAYVTLHLRFALLTEALIILTTVVLYVLACDPLPPRAGHARAWIRGMVPARSANASDALSISVACVLLLGHIGAAQAPAPQADAGGNPARTSSRSRPLRVFPAPLETSSFGQTAPAPRCLPFRCSRDSRLTTVDGLSADSAFQRRRVCQDAAPG